MILDFFQNACILITFLSVVQYLFKDQNIFENISISKKIIFGVCSGILGIILIINSVQIEYDTIIDFRYIPILLSVLYYGIISSIIASSIIGMFRFFFLGVSNSSIIGLINALIVGIGFGIISLLKLSKRSKYVYSMLFLIIVASTSALLTLKDIRLIVRTLILFFSGYLIVSYISIKYADYIIETVETHQKFKKEATKDYLTGLNNVREFDNSFKNISQLTVRKEEDLSLLIIDIDFFKKINDTYGHNAGNNVLKDLTPIFINTCRSYDVVSRIGGEEFSILLLDCPSFKAVKIAERLRENVEKNDFNISDNEIINITISIGVASYPEVTNQVNNLFQNADSALYQAKNTGRNKVMLFNDNT